MITTQTSIPHGGGPSTPTLPREFDRKTDLLIQSKPLLQICLDAESQASKIPLSEEQVLEIKRAHSLAEIKESYTQFIEPIRAQLRTIYTEIANLQRKESNPPPTPYDLTFIESLKEFEPTRNPHDQITRATLFQERMRQDSLFSGKMVSLVAQAIENSDLNMLFFIQELGVSLSDFDLGDETPLMSAVSIKKPLVVQYLIQSKVDCLRANKNHETAFDQAMYIARDQSDTSMLELLQREGIDHHSYYIHPSIGLVEYDTFDRAIIRNSAEDIRYLFEKYPEWRKLNTPTTQGWTRLSLATHHTKTKAMTCLMKLGAKASAKDPEGQNPLIQAFEEAITNSPTEYSEDDPSYIQAIKCLYDNQPVRFEKTDTDGNTIVEKYLREAIRHKKEPLVLQLLQQFSPFPATLQINKVQEGQPSLLSEAVMTENRRIVRFLVRHRADFTKRDGQKQTPEERANPQIKIFFHSQERTIVELVPSPAPASPSVPSPMPSNVRHLISTSPSLAPRTPSPLSPTLSTESSPPASPSLIIPTPYRPSPLNLTSFEQGRSFKLTKQGHPQRGGIKKFQQISMRQTAEALTTTPSPAPSTSPPQKLEGSYRMKKEHRENPEILVYSTHTMRELKQRKVPFIPETSLCRDVETGEIVCPVELCSEGNLREFLATNPILPESERLRLAIQICISLAGIHACRKVHRDIKPENILVTKTRDGLEIRTGDFDFVAECGTPIFPQGTFLAPELVNSEGLYPALPELDLWGLGIVLRDLLIPLHPLTAIQFPIAATAPNVSQNLIDFSEAICRESEQDPTNTIKRLVADLCSINPQKRPPAALVVNVLKSHAATLDLKDLVEYTEQLQSIPITQEQLSPTEIGPSKKSF